MANLVVTNDNIHKNMANLVVTNDNIHKMVDNALSSHCTWLKSMCELCCRCSTSLSWCKFPIQNLSRYYTFYSLVLIFLFFPLSLNCEEMLYLSWMFFLLPQCSVWHSVFAFYTNIHKSAFNLNLHPYVILYLKRSS